MSELYLSKAASAIKEAADTFTGLDEAECEILAKASLPHILDALAKKAEVNAALTHDSIRWAYLRFTTEWLRAEAEEARNA